MDSASNNVHNSIKPADQDNKYWGNSVDNDTTDDEQEGLPYDGILEYYLVPSLHRDQENISDIHEDFLQTFISSKEILQVNSTVESGATDDTSSFLLDSTDECHWPKTVSKSSEIKGTQHESDTLPSMSTIIPDVLLRHFNEESLLNPQEFIDFETMPEISIVESMDETLISRKNCTKDSQFHFNKDEENIHGDESSEIYQNENTENQEDILNNFDLNEELLSLHEDLQKDTEPCELPPVKIKHSKQDQERRFSSFDIKYGQGQVHYKLPDFSKVPPKVKIPKGDVSNLKPNSTPKKPATSPSLMSRSFVIQSILESMQPITKHGQVEDITFCPDFLHVQVAEASVYTANYKPQINFIVSPATDFQQEIESTNNGIQADVLLNFKSVTVAEESQDIQVPTEGEKMSRMLMDQTQQLKTQAFHNLKSCLERLELNYLSTKEKHRDLQLQMYRTAPLMVGEFDLEREVEGQIYRLAMLLEEIQEQINKNEESLTESLPSIKPCEVSVLLHAENCSQESEDTRGMITHSVTEKVVTSQEEEPTSLLSCSLSLNSKTPTDAQAHQEDLVPTKNRSDNCHPMSHLTRISETSDAEFQNDSKSLGQMTTSVTPVDHGLPVQNLISFNLFNQSQIPEMRSTANLHDPEFGKEKGHVQEKKYSDRLGRVIDPDPMFLRSYHREINHITPRCMSIFIQDKASKFEIPYSSSSSSWEKYRKPRLSAGCQLLNPNSPLQDRELHRLKSNGPSIDFKNKTIFSDQTDLSKCSVVKQYVPLSRYCAHASVSCHSSPAAPGTPTLHRKSWPGIKKHSSDDTDSKILNSVLDQALRTAKKMQKTTEKMIEKLGAYPCHSTLHCRLCHW